MRIRGGKDYYDITLAMGADEALQFTRHADRHVRDAETFPGVPRMTIRLPNGKLAGRRYENPWTTPTGDEYHYERGPRDQFMWLVTVLFAGKTYHGLSAVAAERPRGAIIWNGDDLMADASAAGIDLVSFDASFFRGDDGFAVEFLQRNQAAIAVSAGDSAYDREQWQLDPPILGALGFGRVLPPLQASQELAMWLGNQAKPAPPMVTITDEKVVLKKHGMDKWSFRKMPSKKRK